MADQYQRDDKGRFNGTPGPGRKPRAVEEGELADFRAHFSNGRRQLFWEGIDRGLKRGDATIIRLCAEYLIGRPPQQIDLEQTGNMEITVRYVTQTDRDTTA